MSDINKLGELFTYPMRAIFENESINRNLLQEIRIRANMPVSVKYKSESLYFKENGMISKDKKDALIADKEMLMECIQIFSSFSLYAFEDELRQGFITIPGGHRVGICGKVVIEDKQIKTIKNISSINIRIAHQVRGCADTLLKKLIYNNDFLSTLIVSAPGGGKTTLLRDIIRQISDGNEMISGKNVGLIDERSEIAACYRGIAQNDVGIRTDVLDACPKREGMLMLLRSMSPYLIAVDEIGDERDYDALLAAMYCGCRIIATIHSTEYRELLKKPLAKKLLKQNLFQRIVFLRQLKVESVLDKDGMELI